MLISGFYAEFLDWWLAKLHGHSEKSKRFLKNQKFYKNQLIFFEKLKRFLGKNKQFLKEKQTNFCRNSNVVVIKFIAPSLKGAM